MSTSPQNWIRSYDNGLDYLEHLDGVPWHEGEPPPRWHKCTAQTRGWFGLNYTERCRCGAIRERRDLPWLNKNDTRQRRQRDERIAQLPMVTVTCGSCGQPYEAHEGTHQAAERLCDKCWADQLIAGYAS
jgi:hypothetical protein